MDTTKTYTDAEIADIIADSWIFQAVPRPAPDVAFFHQPSWSGEPESSVDWNDLASVLA